MRRLMITSRQPLSQRPRASNFSLLIEYQTNRPMNAVATINPSAAKNDMRKNSHIETVMGNLPSDDDILHWKGG